MELTVYPSESAVAAIVVAHGAGAGQTSPFMVRTARGMAERGIAAATFDFPYMAERRKVPDRAPVLETAWRSAIDAARRQIADVPLFIGGKSMGGRLASHVASQGGAGALAGLVFLGYPLHPPGNPQKRRDGHLPAIVEPMLFVQGSRDTFGTGDEIRALLPSLQRATLHEIAGGDHSFKVPASLRPKGGDDATLHEILEFASRWIKGVIATRE